MDLKEFFLRVGNKVLTSVQVSLIIALSQYGILSTRMWLAP